MSDSLTPDNLHLSRLTRQSHGRAIDCTDHPPAACAIDCTTMCACVCNQLHVSMRSHGVADLSDRSAIDCTDPEPALGATNCTAVIASACNRLHERATHQRHDLPPGVADLIDGALAENSKRAYGSDLAHFARWGGTIPSSEEVLAAYLAAHADEHTVATLSRRLASIAKAHAVLGAQSPTTGFLVKATMRGIARQNGKAQRQAKPLLREDLFAVLATMGERPKDIRDRALLLIGFAGGFRRSELVGLDIGDFVRVRQGVVVHLRRSKTDQLGQGRKIGIPCGRTRWCPVSALDRWAGLTAMDDGPLFRPIDRHGRTAGQRLSSEAVSIIVQERLAAAGFDPTGYSGHSLRAGFATSAAQAGVSTLKIRAQTGHASDAMLARYVREGELFTGNAAGVLL